MHALMYTYTRHGYDREYYNCGCLQQVCLEVHNVGSARQFMADEGVQPKERRNHWKAASVHFVSFVTKYTRHQDEERSEEVQLV